MKRILAVAVLVAMCFGLKLKAFATGDQKMSLMLFEGTYVGLSPTDESAVGMGEIEITISVNVVKIRMATGLRIHEETIPSSELLLMSAAELAEIFKAGSPYAARTTGFKAKSGLPKLLFLDNAGEAEFGLVVKAGEMSEILGPTVLFSPLQIKRGLFEKLFKTIEETAGADVLPRLQNDGKAKKQQNK